MTHNYHKKISQTLIEIPFKENFFPCHYSASRCTFEDELVPQCINVSKAKLYVVIIRPGFTAAKMLQDRDPKTGIKGL